MKIKFNSDGDLPLIKKIKLLDKIIVFRFDNKYYPNVFLDDCLRKLAG